MEQCDRLQLCSCDLVGWKVELEGSRLVGLVFDVVGLVMVEEEDEHVPVVILFCNRFHWEESILVEVVDGKVECHYTFLVVEDVVH